MSGVNRVILVGRLGKKPELRYMTNGDAVANASLATSENWKGKDGQKHERTEWHNLTAYRRIAEVMAEYLDKGALVYIEGKIQTRKWQDKEGRDRYTTEIIVGSLHMLGNKTQETAQPKPESKPEPKVAGPDTDAAGAFPNVDEDVPF